MTKQVTSRWSRALLLEIFELCFIAIGIFGAFFWVESRGFYDGSVREAALDFLMVHGKFVNMDYSYIGPLFSSPLWVIDHHFNPGHDWWLSKYNVFLFMILLGITYILVRKKMDAAVFRKFILILVTASMFVNLNTYYGGEVFTSLLVGMGILIAYLLWEVPGWIAVAVGVANTPASLVALGTMLVTQISMSKRLRYILVGVVAFGLVIADNWITRGNPRNGGYAGQGFTTPFYIGLISILFAFGKGLIFFMPGLFLPVKKYIFRLEGGNPQKLYKVYLLWISFVVGLILVYSPWWSWEGGWTFGPRFFLFGCIPASFVLAVRLRKPSESLFANLLTFGILGWSLVVGLVGLFMDMGLRDLGGVCNSGGNFNWCDYDPHYSVLLHLFVVHTFKIFFIKYYNYALYSVLVIVYLAAPLVWVIAKQTLALLQNVKKYIIDIRV